MKNVLKICAALFVVAVSAAVIAIGVTNGKNSDKVNDRVSKYEKKIAEIEKALENEKKKDAEQGDQENIRIGDEYQIKDTSRISDAYKSGKSDDLNAQEKETLKLASNILKKITKDGMSDYDKEKAIYEWIVKNVPHANGGTAEEVSTPLGVMKGKKAVCVGYATTFRLLANMVGLECKVMHDNSCIHSWDICKLDDKWYITDCYLDAEGSPMYSSFNMTDAQARIDSLHDWDASLFPRADGTKYSYAIMNSKKLKDPVGWIDSVAKIIKKAGEDSLIYSYEVDTTDEKNAFTANYVYKEMNKRLTGGFSLNKFKNGDKFYYIFAKAKDYNGEEEPEEPSADEKKFDKLLNESFGEIPEW